MQLLTVNSAMTRLGDLLGLTSLFVLFSTGKDKTRLHTDHRSNVMATSLQMSSNTINIDTGLIAGDSDLIFL